MRFAKLINRLFHLVDQHDKRITALERGKPASEFSRMDLRWLKGLDGRGPVGFAAWALTCREIRAEYDRRQPGNKIPRGGIGRVTLDQLAVALASDA